MKLLVLTSVLLMLLGKRQFPFVNGQVQDTTTIQYPRQSSQHTLQSHHNHQRNLYQQPQAQSQRQHHHRHSANPPTSLQQVTPHYARHHHHHHHSHHRHHEENNYYSNNSRKHHVYNVTHRTTATTLPNVAYTEKSEHSRQQTTTSSPVLKYNSNNQHQHQHQQQQQQNQQQQWQWQQQQEHQHHHYDLKNEQQEFRAHHHHHHHRFQKENQHQLSPEGVDGSTAQKSIKTDAISRQSFEAVQDNRIDLQENEHLDTDDYYYQNENDESNENESEDSNYYADDEKLYYTRKYDYTYNDREYARVARDHQSNSRQFDQDYVNDEPSESGFVNNTKPGVLTEQKFRELGTPESVQKSRDKYFREKSEYSQATEHISRMQTASICSRPMPRVIYVSNETSKSYLPRATILHRCGSDTGCCKSTSQICTVKTYEDVRLYFLVVNLSDHLNPTSLVLRNHTECHCVDLSTITFEDAQRRGKRSGDAICRCPRHYDILQENEHPTVETVRQAPQQHQNHRAPVAHELPSPAVRSSNMNCRCDCLSTNVDCQRLKDGKEGFSIEDRTCIASQKCMMPKCRLGTYNLQTGRCPHLRNHKRFVRHNDNGNG